MQTSIAISTYMTKSNFDYRFNFFKLSIDSLMNSEYKGNIIIIDDGSEIQEHLDYIKKIKYNKLSFHIKANNQGVAKCKNTSMRLAIENSDIGFIADDDLIYKTGWDTIYTDAISKTHFSHFTFCAENRSEQEVVNNNGLNILKLKNVNGCFFTVTKNILDTIGYMRILPYKFGHEHSNFSIRCINKQIIPYFVDVEKSDTCLNVQQDSFSKRSIDIDISKYNENALYNWKDLDVTWPCIE